MRYQKFPPFKDLKPFIECYFVWEGEAAEQMEVQSPPNCFCAMVFKTYYLFGSYVMFISEDIRFKPSLLLRASSGSPLSADLNAMFTFRELYTGGIFTRNFNSYGIIAQATFGAFRFGYVFELPGSSTSSVNFNSHEIMVGISTALLGFHDLAHKTF